MIVVVCLYFPLLKFVLVLNFFPSQFLSMKLSTVNPRMDHMEALLSKEVSFLFFVYYFPTIICCIPLEFTGNFIQICVFRSFNLEDLCHSIHFIL